MDVVRVDLGFLRHQFRLVAVVRHGRVRRAKLYYLRGLSGRAARVKERRGVLGQVVEGSGEVAAEAPAPAATAEAAAQPPAAESAPSAAEKPAAPDRKSTRLNSSHIQKSRMPSSA